MTRVAIAEDNTTDDVSGFLGPVNVHLRSSTPPKE